MNVKLLIDAIMRQTTVLIAQLSTAAGVRAPLAHLADQVFVTLAKEIEAQGVGRKVVADMFGMALRSYQKKTQRLGGSQTEQGKTEGKGVGTRECCTENQGSADQLIDIESYTNERWGVLDGEIEWADLGPTSGMGCD